GGFTAFGRILGSGMSIVNTFNNSSIYPDTSINFGNATLTVPAKNLGNNQYQLEYISSIQVLNIPAGDYDGTATVSKADYNVWRSEYGSTTLAEADGNGNGR